MQRVMIGPSLTLLHRRELFWQRVQDQQRLSALVCRCLVFVLLSSAAYGAALAAWRSPELALYVAIKLPLLMVGTTVVVMMLNYVVAAGLGSGLGFAQVVAVTWGAMTVACWILLGLLPVTLFFTVGVASREGTHAQLTLTHNCLLLTHVLLIASAGLAGNAALREGLRRLVAPGCSTRLLYWCWLAAFTLVGCQLSWILRPFIGHPLMEVAFLRPDALEWNFFEYVLTVLREVLQHPALGVL